MGPNHLFSVTYSGVMGHSDPHIEWLNPQSFYSRDTRAGHPSAQWPPHMKNGSSILRFESALHFKVTMINTTADTNVV